LYSVVLISVVISNPVYSQIFKIFSCIHRPNNLVYLSPLSRACYPRLLPQTPSSDSHYHDLWSTSYEMGRDSPIGTAAGYGPNGSESNPCREQGFLQSSRTALGILNLLYNGYRGENSRGMTLTTPPQHSAEVKEKVKLHIYSPCGHSWASSRVNFTLHIKLLVVQFCRSAGLLARSQYPEGSATGHLDTGFSWFPCVYKRLLRWFPSFQVATTCFSCSPPDLKFLVTFFFVFLYM